MLQIRRRHYFRKKPPGTEYGRQLRMEDLDRDLARMPHVTRATRRLTAAILFAVEDVTVGEGGHAVTAEFADEFVSVCEGGSEEFARGLAPRTNCTSHSDVATMRRRGA